MSDITVSGALPAGDMRYRSTNVRKVLDQLPSDDCVRWPGMHDRQGYGVIASRITHIAHRYIWILLFGEPETRATRT